MVTLQLGGPVGLSGALGGERGHSMAQVAGQGWRGKRPTHTQSVPS